MRLPLNNSYTIAIIGGGRWGQLILSLFVEMNLPFHFVVVSDVNYSTICNQLNNIPLNAFGTFSVVKSINELLACYKIDAAVIVNSARQHFETAKLLIKKKIHLLIEKPIVLTTQEINLLIEQATYYKTVLIPGLSFRFCSYIYNFGLFLKKHTPSDFNFVWEDTANEIRYSQKKRHDYSIDIIQDVMPHIWTILSIIFNYPIKIKKCETTNPLMSANIFLEIGDIAGTISMIRNSPIRKRYLSVNCLESTLSIDFTREPGIINENLNISSGDPFWKQRSSPLTLQLYYFLSAIFYVQSDLKDLKDAYQSVLITDEASKLLNKNIVSVT